MLAQIVGDRGWVEVLEGGLSVLPDWLLQEEGASMPITALRIGPTGLPKSISLGLRAADAETDYLRGFIEIAGRVNP